MIKKASVGLEFEVLELFERGSALSTCLDGGEVGRERLSSRGYSGSVVLGFLLRVIGYELVEQ